MENLRFYVFMTEIDHQRLSWGETSYSGVAVRCSKTKMFTESGKFDNMLDNKEEALRLLNLLLDEGNKQ